MFVDSVIKGMGKTTGGVIVFGVIGIAYLGVRGISTFAWSKYFQATKQAEVQTQTESAQASDDTKYKKVLDMFM